ncbi:hypothetical protein ACO1MP_14135, partial [Staphylococcus aureus]
DKPWVVASDDVDMYFKNGHKGKLTSEQIQMIKKLEIQNKIRLSFNANFFAASDSREPELAGIWGGVIGSFLTLLITFITAFPLGVGTALYLEE